MDKGLFFNFYKVLPTVTDDENSVKEVAEGSETDFAMTNNF